MQIVALIAALGAMLGQPQDPPDQDVPPAEEQEGDADAYPAEDPPADQPDADAPPAEGPPPPAAGSAGAEDQPAEAGSDEAGGELDSATGWRGGANSWVFWMRNAFSVFRGRTYGPFTVTRVYAREPTMFMEGSVRGRHSPEQWDVLEQQLSSWLCAEDGWHIIRLGGAIVLELRDEAGESRTVRITQCEGPPEAAR